MGMMVSGGIEMQVTALVEKAQIGKLSPLQRKVFTYLEDHPDEVFEYRDAELAAAVGGKPSSVGFSLWALQRKGLIEKESVGGKVYFGSRKAINALRQKLGAPSKDLLDRARRNRERIRQYAGNIDTLTLLDEVREVD
jgi:hypothetical protein